MRNIFHGGPLDGNVIMTDIITDGGEFVTHLPFEEYDGSATPTAGIDGMYQRNWYWTGIGEISVEQGDTDGQTEGSDGGSETSPKPAAAKPAQEKTDLRRRREDIKISRGPIADRAGLTVGKVARIETKGGTDEEVAAYISALEHYEANPDNG